MQNKNKAIIISALGIILFIIVAIIYTYQPTYKNDGTIVKEGKNTNVNLSDYAKDQNQFLMDMPCGITDFDSPYVKSIQCDPQKMQKGESVTLTFKGRIVDEQGTGIEKVKIAVNNQESFYTDQMGFYEAKITVDSNKKLINLVADKFGYSPIRKIFNALQDTGEGVPSTIPQIFIANNIGMRNVDIQKVRLNDRGDTIIVSKKYPDVSITVPANGLVNANGKIVTGEITAEITYLDPENPDDVDFVPGFNGSMVGVDRKGRQVTLKSGGMVFFHLKQIGSDEILQPKEGGIVTIAQPLFFERADYFRALNESNNESDKKLELYKSDEEFNKMLESDKMFFNYWYFNQKTGLWEEWPVKAYDIDLENNVSIMAVSRLY